MKTTTTPSDNEGLGPKKTMFVMVTVVGCIAILWPKVFHPMVFGSAPPTQAYKQYSPGAPGFKCCEVILDQEVFANTSYITVNTSTLPIGPHLFRSKSYEYFPDEVTSLRQERPPHMRPGGVHPAMLERGRAIPNTQTVPIVDRARSPRDSPVRIVDGRPGPIPGMRPPMGAGSVHQAQPKGNSMGIIMPLYTIGIIAFFCYTVMKLAFKKPPQNEPYTPSATNGTSSSYKKDAYEEKNGKNNFDIHPKIGWKEHDAIVTAVQGLIDEYDKTYGNDTTSKDKDSDHQNGNISNGHVKKEQSSNVEDLKKENASEKLIDSEKDHTSSSGERKKREGSVEKAVTSSHRLNGHEEPRSIYLQGALPHESQILVADSEITTERARDLDFEEDEDEPAVVLSSKISLSLINMSSGSEDAEDDFEKVKDENQEIDIIQDIGKEEIEQNDEHVEEIDEQYEEEHCEINEKNNSDEN